jgi:hypothetical protein
MAFDPNLIRREIPAMVLFTVGESIINWPEREDHAGIRTRHLASLPVGFLDTSRLSRESCSSLIARSGMALENGMTTLSG